MKDTMWLYSRTSFAVEVFSCCWLMLKEGLTRDEAFAMAERWAAEEDERVSVAEYSHEGEGLEPISRVEVLRQTRSPFASRHISDSP